jgi:hypothetical protein
MEYRQNSVDVAGLLSGVSQGDHAQLIRGNMENKFEDFFADNAEPIVIDVESETPEAAEVEEVEESAEPEIAEPVVQVEVARPDDRTDPTKWVPVAAMTAERQKAKNFQDKVAALETQLAQYLLQPSQATTVASQSFQAQGIPDPYDDPQAYNQYVLAQATQIARNEMQLSNFQQSRVRAAAKYGEEYLNEVAEWAGTLPPEFEAQVLSQPDPVEWAVAEKKRLDLINSFQADPDAYVRARAAELGLAAISGTQATPIMEVKDTGPKSLVNAKSRNEAVSIKQKAKDDFDDLFRK